MATFKNIEIGIHSKAEPTTRPIVERIPTRARIPRAIISDAIATALLGAEMAKRWWQCGQKEPPVTPPGRSLSARSKEFPQLGHWTNILAIIRSKSEGDLLPEKQATTWYGI
jgi:hypothetical protein